MNFSVTFTRVLESRIRRLAATLSKNPAARLFWIDLASILAKLAESPEELGEIQFGYKHVELQVYVAVIGFLAVHYAVNAESDLCF
jgi:hypothetical protein